jgi:hypothetical protein
MTTKGNDHPMTDPIIQTHMPPEWWRVYNYIARNWYEQEYGTDRPRWYYPAMLWLENFADRAAPEAR